MMRFSLAQIRGALALLLSLWLIAIIRLIISYQA
jgi:hypothetical protein